MQNNNNNNNNNNLRKLQEQLSEFSMVAGQNINTEKSIAFLYTDS